jgi:hypothetical protein
MIALAVREFIAVAWIVLVLFGVAVVAAISGCGGSIKQEAFVAVVGACDQVEQQLEIGAGEDVVERIGCIRAVCNEALRQIDPEAADEL